MTDVAEDPVQGAVEETVTIEEPASVPEPVAEPLPAEPPAPAPAVDPPLPEPTPVVPVEAVSEGVKAEEPSAPPLRLGVGPTSRRHAADIEVRALRTETAKLGDRYYQLTEGASLFMHVDHAQEMADIGWVHLGRFQELANKKTDEQGPPNRPV